MVDIKAREKHRTRINKLIQEKLEQNPGKSEVEVRKEVNRELRDKRKTKKKDVKNTHLQNVEKIKQEIKAKMGDADDKALQKATAKAVAKYYSDLKKGKNQSINKKCEQLMANYNKAKWKPSGNWFGKKCQRAYDDLYFMGAMMDINLEKNPAPMEQLFPEECKAYFDLLAKQRFKKSKKTEEESKEDVPKEDATDVPKKKRSKPKSALNKKIQDILATNDGTKTEKEMLEKAIAEVKENEKQRLLKDLRKKWRPTDKPWFDKDCKAAYKALVAKGAENELKLGEVSGDYKKFKTKFKAETKTYFKLLADKKEAFDNEDKEKKAALKNEH